MIEASAKMSLLFAIVEESVRVGDRVLLFSQSLFTLDLIEEFLQRNKIPGKDENWCRNCDYYRKYNNIHIILNYYFFYNYLIIIRS